MFSPFFLDDPFGYQPRAQRHRNNVPFFMDEDYEDPQSYYRRPQQPQRQVPVNPMRRSPHVQQQPQQPKQPQPQQSRRNVPRAPQKQAVKPRPKMPDVETCHRAATNIQRAFRGFQIRKLQLVPKLKQLTKVESDFKLIQLKFQHVTEVLQQLFPQTVEQIDFTNYRITHKKLLECEEEMTKKLISLDSISSGQSQFIRTTRKQIVEAISSALQALEPIKKNSIQKLQQLQEYHAALEQQKLAEQARQSEAQNANTKVETRKEAEQSNGEEEDSEELPTVSDPMEEEQSEECATQEEAPQKEVVVEDITSLPESINPVKIFDPTTLSTMCYQTIQELLNRQNRLLEEKDNYIKTLQSRIEQLEHRAPAVAAQ